MATVRIGDVRSFARPEDWTYTPDDRQQKVEIINGVAIQDFGHIEAGDTMSFSANFRRKDFDVLVGYWSNRVLVDIEDASGTIFQKCRVVIKSYSYIDYFESSMVKATLEIWRA